jgi:hypothetical protein
VPEAWIIDRDIQSGLVVRIITLLISIAKSSSPKLRSAEDWQANELPNKDTVICEVIPDVLCQVFSQVFFRLENNLHKEKMQPADRFDRISKF